MSTTQKKYARLTHPTKHTDNNSDSENQLYWPHDLLDSIDNPGFYVMFQLWAPKTSVKNEYMQIGPKKPNGTIYKKLDPSLTQPRISRVEESRGSAASTAQSWKNYSLYAPTNQSIILPMPDQIDSLYNVIWENTEFGSLGRIADFFRGDNDSQMLQSDEVIFRTLSALIPGINGRDAYSLGSQLTENHYQEVLFRGVSNRYLPMFWTLTPRNYKEAVMIQKIIHRLKFAMHPELWMDASSNNNAYLVPPYVFDIIFIDNSQGQLVKGFDPENNPGPAQEIIGENSRWMWKINTCALTSLMVNGTPMGEFSVLKDGALSAQTIELSFLELMTLNKDQFTSFTNTH